ncbi:hypothetical protein B0T26DRAFT_713436 [Lasiosphaeria miniovina]|uniref:SMP-30/Gluconolactonase/LRE-like region domain-containing protein n=1 Tax=Lasiosphaeria miniovina TaxID=1954250 RepID=A0AA40AMH8_9PEZI|nr:uncharacterized protein B0T26DRAFT_713436 [Lasiosphaeria miniovina]KAK0718485.1 hypothetical protein B0T26DRAFT_713436 [Lasiosphaeria miniovina]
MYKPSMLLSLLVLFVSDTFATPFKPQARQIYAFPDNATFIENVAVRPNGHILLGTFSNGSLFSLNPDTRTPEAELVAKLPGVGALVGIAEIAPDVFAVGGGDLLPEGFGFVNGSMKVYTVDVKKKKVKVAASLPAATGLNGITPLPGHPGVVLAAESVAGQILRINTATGRIDVAIADTQLGPSSDPAIVPLGVNGIKVSNGYLYFTNSGLGFFGRIKITASGERAGQVERITSIENPGFTHAFDDFVFGSGLTPDAYVALHPNSIQRIAADGEQTLFVGGDGSNLMPYPGPTSVALSRDGRKIYIVTGLGQVVEATLPK